MQAHYPASFEREMACTGAEFESWLVDAAGGLELVRRDGGADIVLGQGLACIEWQALEPRRIGLIVLPRLHVRFETRGVDPAAWQRFMRHFDLRTLRGGG
jgi:hypothetical protein